MVLPFQQRRHSVPDTPPSRPIAIFRPAAHFMSIKRLASHSLDLIGDPSVPAYPEHNRTPDFAVTPLAQPRELLSTQKNRHCYNPFDFLHCSLGNTGSCNESVITESCNVCVVWSGPKIQLCDLQQRLNPPGCGPAIIFTDRNSAVSFLGELSPLAQLL